MKFCTIALVASTATAFAPSNSVTRVNKHGFAGKTQQQSRLPLLLEPSLGIDMANLGTDSALLSSSITTSNFLDGLVSNVGGFVLIASVGAGVYSSTLQEKHNELQKILNDKFQKKTGDDFAAKAVKQPVAAVEVSVQEVADTVEEPEEVVEEMEDVSREVLVSTPAPLTATSEKLLEETEKAIAEVKAKGVQETKAKMSFNESVTSPVTSSEPVEEPKTEVAEKEKDPRTKKQIVQGVTLIVSALGVALARNVIKAWIGRGMF